MDGIRSGSLPHESSLSVSGSGRGSGSQCRVTRRRCETIASACVVLRSRAPSPPIAIALPLGPARLRSAPTSARAVVLVARATALGSAEVRVAHPRTGPRIASVVSRPVKWSGDARFQLTWRKLDFYLLSMCIHVGETRACAPLGRKLGKIRS